MTVTLPELVGQANAGSEAAWASIVDRFSGLVWATARAHRLSPAQAADVTQNTWLRLVENLDRVQDPERLGAWLATTARRECLRCIRLSQREQPTDEEWISGIPSPGDAVDAGLLGRERDAGLRRALAAISERCQELLRLVAAPEPPSYEEIGAALGMPVGAIGPTRARCLEKLRLSTEHVGLDLR
jgi:RNA polymerase sigma factor (sigma-70 family)